MMHQALFDCQLICPSCGRLDRDIDNPGAKYCPGCHSEMISVLDFFEDKSKRGKMARVTKLRALHGR